MKNERDIAFRRHGYSHSDFEKLLSLIQPNGGRVVVLSAYFDESGTHGGANVLVVAGYLFEDKQAARFSRDWGKFLKSEGIAFAHMSELANGAGHYEGMSKPNRVKHGRALIENIKRRSKVGFAADLPH